MKNPNIIAEINLKMIEAQRIQQELFINNKVRTSTTNIKEQAKNETNYIQEKEIEDMRKRGIEINALELLNQREKSQLVAISAVGNIQGKTINRLEESKKIQDSIEEDIQEKNFESKSEQLFRQTLGIKAQTENKLKEVENFRFNNKQSKVVRELEKQVTYIKSINDMYKFRKQEQQVQDTRDDVQKTKDEIEENKLKEQNGR
jgi:hypothetical protein